MSLGFEQAGFDILAATEYDPIHAAVHAFNFPHTEIVCADMALVEAADLRAAAVRGWRAHGHAGRWNGQLDVVIGGPPCQGFSMIGKRASDDPRNWLVFHFARLVGELQPRYFVMENVPGMAHAVADEKQDSLLDILIEVFEDSGYDVNPPRLLNASSWGVPQNRRRLFVLGTRRGEPALAYPTPRRNSRSTDSTAMEYDRSPTVWDAIGDLPDLDQFSALTATDEVILSTGQLADMRRAMSPYARILHTLDEDEDDYSWPRNWNPQVLTSSCRTKHRPDVIARFDDTLPGRPEPISRLRRLDAQSVSSTLRAGTHYERGSFNAPRPIHPLLPRVISVREGARLHSFPDWFRLHWTKWHGFRQLGNSLPPRLGRAVGAEVMRSLGASPQRPSRTIILGDEVLLTMENLAAAAHFEADTARIPRNELRKRKAAETVSGALAA